MQEERDGLVASVRSGVVQSQRALAVLMVHASTVAGKNLERGGGADLCGLGQGGFFPPVAEILAPRLRSRSTVSGVRPQ